MVIFCPQDGRNVNRPPDERGLRGPYSGKERAAKCAVMARPVRKLVAAIRFPMKRGRIPTPVISVIGSE